MFRRQAFLACNHVFLIFLAVGLLAANSFAQVKPAATKPAPVKTEKLKFAIKDHVEVKWGGQYRKAAVLNTRDGWYLIAYDGFTGDSAREWVEPLRVRKIGSTDDPIDYAQPHPYSHNDGPPKGSPVLATKQQAAAAQAAGIAPPAVNTGLEPAKGTAAGGVKARAYPPEIDYSLVQIDRSNVIPLSENMSDKAWHFKPVPITGSKTPSPKTMLLQPTIGYFDKMEKLLFTSPEVATVTAVCCDPASNGRPTYYMEQFDLSTGKSIGTIALPPRYQPLAIAPDGKALLCRQVPPNGRQGDDDRVEWFELGVSGAKHVASWKVVEEIAMPDSHGVVSAAFVDPTHVFIRTGKIAGSLWSVERGKPSLVYTISLIFGSEPCLLASNKLLEATGSQGVNFYDALTGQPVGFIPAAGWRRGLAFSNPDGSQIVLTQESSLDIIDGTTGKTARSVTGFKGMFYDRIDFVGRGMLLLGTTNLASNDQLLCDPVRNRTFWNYKVSNQFGKLNCVYNGRLYYGSFPEPKGEQDLRQAWIASAEVPHAAAIAAEAGENDQETMAGETELTPGGLAADSRAK